MRSISVGVKSLNTSRMQADKATAGPTGLLKGCTATGVVLKLHRESLLRLEPVPCRRALPRPLPCPHPLPRPYPLPRPLPLPLCSGLLCRVRIRTGAPSDSSSLLLCIGM